MPGSLPYPSKGLFRELGVYVISFTAKAAPAMISDPAGAVTLSDDGAGTYGFTFDDSFPLLHAFANMRGRATVDQDDAWVDSINLTTKKVVVKTLVGDALADPAGAGKTVDVFFILGRTT